MEILRRTYAEWEVWVCPEHGIIPEGELLEGFTPTSNPDGDGYNDRFYCALDHEIEKRPEVYQHDIRSSAWNQNRSSEEG